MGTKAGHTSNVPCIINSIQDHPIRTSERLVIIKTPQSRSLSAAHFWPVILILHYTPSFLMAFTADVALSVLLVLLEVHAGKSRYS